MTTSCPACELYDMSRGAVIRAEIAKTTPREDREARWRTFMDGVHERHLDAAMNAAIRRGLGRFAALVAYANEDVDP